MRIAALLTLLLAMSATAQERGVFTTDIDRNVDACTNFFDYSNGAWRAANPIPASMTRWSRRWAAGELNKEQFYQQYLGGAKEMKPRWKRCVETGDELLGEALGQRYVERYFPAEAKARMQEMVKNLLAAMGDTIRGLDWMGPQTKQQALAKLSTFNPKVVSGIGGPTKT